MYQLPDRSPFDFFRAFEATQVLTRPTGNYQNNIFLLFYETLFQTNPDTDSY